MKWRLLVTSIPVLGALALGACELTDSAHAGDADFQKAEYTDSGELKLPHGWREWVFIGSPLTPHGLNGGAAGFPEYHNVYIQPGAYKHYQATGEFPEGTILFKELQLVAFSEYDDGSSDQPSGRGFFPGEVAGVDIAVKDTAKYPETNGWGFYNFGHHGPPYAESAALAPKDACAFCHEANAEQDMIFTQFYQILKKPYNH